MEAEKVPGLPFLDLAGSPREIGVALGRFGRAAVRDYLAEGEAWRRVIAFRGSERASAMARIASERFPAIVEEIEGLAEGLAVPFEDAFLWNCRGDLWAFAPDGCTTLRVPGERERWIAHNEDGDPGLMGRCAVARIASRGSQAFTSFLYPGSIPGHNFAVNDAGLVQTVNNIRALDCEAGVPRMILARAVLDCTSLDGAVELIRQTPRGGAFHLSLAQRGDRRLLGVEYTSSRVSAIEIAAGCVHANHLIHGDMADLPQLVTASSEARQKRGAALVAAAADEPPGDLALRVLGDHSGEGLPIYRDDPQDPDHENTLATAIFHICDDRVEWRVHSGPERALRLASRGGLLPAAA